MLRKSFTMLELTIAIVITGLIGIVGSKALVQIIQNYAIQKEYNKLEIDSASAIRQLSKYLQDSIWDSIAIKNGNNYKSIFEINTSNNGNITNMNNLVFIEKKKEVIDGYFNNNRNIPIFSGLIDLNSSRGRNLRTLINTDRLSTLTNNNIAIYFPYVNMGNDVKSKFYENSARRTALFTINAFNGNNNIVLSKVPSKIGDIAIITNDKETIIGKDNNGNVYINNNNNVILQNVDSINIWAEATIGILRIKICFNNKTMDFMPKFCKEGVVLK